MGAPNDEARHGHRLRDLAYIRWIGEVLDSALIAELEVANRVHRGHDPRRYESLRHWVVPLKECTVEVVAQALEVQRRNRADLGVP
jgi:hypothetical protein